MDKTKAFKSLVAALVEKEAILDEEITLLRDRLDKRSEGGDSLSGFLNVGIRADFMGRLVKKAFEELLRSKGATEFEVCDRRSIEQLDEYAERLLGCMDYILQKERLEVSSLLYQYFGQKDKYADHLGKTSFGYSFGFSTYYDKLSDRFGYGCVDSTLKLARAIAYVIRDSGLDEKPSLEDLESALNTRHHGSFKLLTPTVGRFIKYKLYKSRIRAEISFQLLEKIQVLWAESPTEDMAEVA
jgi:hypothetical protein